MPTEPNGNNKQQPTRIGLVEGHDLLARMVLGQGFYGTIEDIELPEIGPFKGGLDQVRTVLEQVFGIFQRYKSAKRTMQSSEYHRIMEQYGLMQHLPE